MQNMLVVNAEVPRPASRLSKRVPSLSFVERKRDRGMVGNIYRGKVTRVLPGMQAAFVDLGSRSSAPRFFMSPTFSDRVTSASCSKTARPMTTTSRPKARASVGRASSSRIARSKSCSSPGQSVVCQVTKDPIGLKGARVTGYVSLPGRYSVFMPHVGQVGVSKRIGSDKERRRLRDIVNASATQRHRLHRPHRGRRCRRSRATRRRRFSRARVGRDRASRRADDRARLGLRRSRSRAALYSRSDARGHQRGHDRRRRAIRSRAQVHDGVLAPVHRAREKVRGSTADVRSPSHRAGAPTGGSRARCR